MRLSLFTFIFQKQVVKININSQEKSFNCEEIELIEAII